MLSFKKNGRAIARITPIKREKGKKYPKNKFLYLTNNEEKGVDNVKAPDGFKFEIMPNPNIAEHVYCSAPSGAGKSTIASKYIKEYKKMKKFKNDKIYLISNVSEDKVLDDIKDIKRIKLDSDVIEDPIHPSELKDGIIVFDDSDNLPNKLMRQAILNLRSACLEESRHYGSRLFICNHISMSGASTRPCINEAKLFIFFPRHSSPYYINRYLQIYVGLGKKDRKKLLNLKSRWVAINRFDRFALWDDGAMILKTEMN